MSNPDRPSYDELSRRLEAAEAELKAIQRGRIKKVHKEPETFSSDPGNAMTQQDHLKNVLLAMRNISLLIVSEYDPKRLVDQACVKLTDTMGYFNTWISLFGGDPARSLGLPASGAVSVIAVAGLDHQKERLQECLENGEFPNCMRRAIACEKVLVIDNPFVDCPDCALHEQYEGRSGLASRLIFDGVVYGTLTASVPAAYAQDKEQQDLFSELAGHLAFALHKIAVERELLESEARYRRIVADQTELIVRFMSDGTLTWVNECAAQYAGLKALELLGRNFLDFLSPGEQRNALQNLAEISVENPVRESTQQLILANGESRWLQWRNRGIFNAHGRLVEFLGVGRDITQQRHAEEALRESEQRLSLATESAGIGIWDWNILTDQMEWDERIFELYGIETIPETYGLEYWQSCLHPDDRTPTVEACQAAVRGEKKYDVEFRVLWPDGTIHWMKGDGVVLRDDEGSPIRMLGTNYDITEQRTAEAALRESEDFLNRTGEMAQVGGWQVELQTQKVMWTRTTCRIHEVPEGYVPELEEAIDYYHPEDQEKVRQSVGRAIEKGEPFDFTVRLITAKGRQRWVRAIGQPIFDADKCIRLSGTFQDITESKRIIEERERLSNQLLQAQKMEAVGRLAGGVAHDFNNKLGVILGHTDMILEDMDPEQPIYDDLREIRKAGLHSAELTRQLLAFARKQTVAPKVIELNKTVQGMLKMLERLIGENIQMIWKPGEDVWPVKIDPNQIDQIMANLCVNARDAIADIGTVTIKTGNTILDEEYCVSHPDFEPGEYAMLSVSDDGCGMDADTLSHVFEPFFTTKALGKGTGLGLATVYGVIKQNNGHINVSSQNGKGTTFEIFLPRQETKNLHAMANNMPVECGLETILLVEDDPAILRMAKKMLEQLGYTVVAAGKPVEAIGLANEYPGEIQLLLTDVVMPGMNGRDLAEKMKSIFPNLKRLFMSGYTANVIASKGILEKDVNFIQKPFTKKELDASVRKALDRE